MLAYLVARAHLVAAPEAVALVVQAASVAAPALVSVLGGHVSGTLHVAVSQTDLETKRKKKKKRKTSDEASKQERQASKKRRYIARVCRC